MRLKLTLRQLLAVAIILLGSLPGTVRADPNTIAVPALPPVTQPDSRFGIVQGIAAPQLAAAAGARWDRIIFPWSLIQKDGPDSWRELYYSDQLIRAQVARGISVAGVIIYTPQWASVNPDRGRPVDRPKGLELRYNHPENYWGQFVRKLVARHKGVVDDWIIWNEPDLYDGALRYTWDASFEDYFLLLKVAYLNIKEVNPNARVILGGMAYWWDKEADRPPYIASLIEVIGRDPDRVKNNYYFDVMSVHAYAAPLNSFAEPLLMKEILDLRGIKKPIWISESNVVPNNDPANPLGPEGIRATLDQQASYVIQSMALALAAGVEKYAIYKMTDEAAENNTEMWGLARNDLSIKPAYVAYQVATTYFANARSAVFTWPGAGERPGQDEIVQLLRSNKSRTQFIWPAQVSQVVMERGNRRTTVVWNNSPADVIHNVPATANVATKIDKYGRGTQIRSENGVYPISLPGSTHNPDRRDHSIYMIGGDPFIIDEAVVPLPTERVRANIEMVWPHGGAPLAEASLVNVTAQLLDPSGDPVACRWQPDSVQLWMTIDGGPKQLVGTGARRIAQEGGVRYPVWDFNRVSVASARDEKTVYRFSVTVDDLETESSTWTYGGTAPTDWRAPVVRPKKSCE
ncbi:MAG: hypothetical protein U0821_09610 [Chloroflexota bacterium]